MSYTYLYSAEEVDDNQYGVINESSPTGHLVLTLQSEEAAVFYADLMNEVYNQIKNDIETGWITPEA